MEMKKNKFTLLLMTFCLFVTSIAQADTARATAKEEIQFSSVKYYVMTPPFEAQFGYADILRELEWSYPIMTDRRFRNRTKLNEWLRATTLKAFFPRYSKKDFKEILRLKDSEVIDLLKLIRTDLLSIRLSDMYAYGNNIFFNFHYENMGAYHPYFSNTRLIFNLDKGREVDVYSFFRRRKNVVEDIVQLIGDVHQKDIAEDDEEEDQDINNCLNRDLEWDELEIRGASEISIPYKDAEKNEDLCPKTDETLEGHAVRALFVNPSSLEPFRYTNSYRKK